MSDRPTPETDDIARGNHVVPTEWAQQLERERDEARELHRNALRAREATEREVDAMLERAHKAELERDEAREKVEQQRKEIVRLNGSTSHAGGTPLKIALRERDEAREALEFRRELYKVQEKCLEDARRERDEAREALMKIEDLFIDCTDVIACREKMGMIAIAALQEIK